MGPVPFIKHPWGPVGMTCEEIAPVRRAIETLTDLMDEHR